MKDLKEWFEVSDYKVHNECRAIEINIKANLTNEQQLELIREIAKYIANLRILHTQILSKMYDAIDGKYRLSVEEKSKIIQCFSRGFISEKQYGITKDYEKSFDNEAIQGYFGEVLYYIIREQFLEDEKIAIEPKKPKYYSKDSGLDFLEIRKDENNEYYFIIGEIKTSTSNIGSYPDKIIDKFQTRDNRIFAEQYNLMKENYKESEDKDLVNFINDVLDKFFGFGKFGEEKRYSGVINYNYKGQAISSTAFQNYKDKLKDLIIDKEKCRRIKIVGIRDINKYIEGVRDLIWKNCLK